MTVRHRNASIIPSRNFLIRQLQARPHFFIAIALGAAGFALLPGTIDEIESRLLVAWNIGAVSYLAMASVMMMRSTSDYISQRADIQSESRIAVLAGVILATFACLAAIFAEIHQVREMHGAEKAWHLVLIILTIASSWAFIHLMFALHYAHDFHTDLARGHGGGLRFPGTDKPGYLEFIYFATIIGTSGQTADVSISSSRMRRWSLLHCVLAYTFNTTVLALTINIAAGLL